MATKVVKVTKYVGQCNDDGISVPETAFMVNTKDAYQEVSRAVQNLNAITTGPARMLIIVEQEVVTNDE